jgi:hypothetical protein
VWTVVRSVFGSAVGLSRRVRECDPQVR